MYCTVLTVEGRLSFGLDPSRPLTRNTATVTAELMLCVIRVKTRRTTVEQFHYHTLTMWMLLQLRPVLAVWSRTGTFVRWTYCMLTGTRMGIEEKPD